MNKVETVYVVGGNEEDGWVVWSELWVGRTLLSNQIEGVFETENEARIHRDGLQAAYAEQEKISPGSARKEFPGAAMIEPDRDFDPVEPAYLCPDCGHVITWGEDAVGNCNYCGYHLPIYESDDAEDLENDAK